MSVSEPVTNFVSEFLVNRTAGEAPCTRHRQRARDGSEMRWDDVDPGAASPVIAPGTAAPVIVAVSPVWPGHVVTVDYRVNRGLVRQVTAVPDLRTRDLNSRVFRAILPGQPSGLVEFQPVLRFAGQPISPRLVESAEPSRYQVGPVAASPAAVAQAGPPSGRPSLKPRWAWSTRFLGALTAMVRKEVVGATPDGFRIDWHVTKGSFVGPGFECDVLPGATDWMRIRQDGVAIVDVQACFETRTGARIYGSYGGIFDLGPDGYARALRDEFDPLPPVVVTPTYVTADKQLEWLNRAQCIGVGRVDMAAGRVEFDVHVVEVGDAHPQTGGPPTKARVAAPRHVAR